MLIFKKNHIHVIDQMLGYLAGGASDNELSNAGFDRQQLRDIFEKVRTVHQTEQFDFDKLLDDTEISLILDSAMYFYEQELKGSSDFVAVTGGTIDELKEILYLIENQ